MNRVVQTTNSLPTTNASIILIINIFYINVESHKVNINRSLNLTYTKVNFSQSHQRINGKLIFYVQYSITILIILIQLGLITRFTFSFRTRFSNAINNRITQTPSNNVDSQQTTILLIKILKKLFQN